MINSFADGKKQKRLSVGMDVVERIQKIVSERKAVFAYNELEYETGAALLAHFV